MSGEGLLEGLPKISKSIKSQRSNIRQAKDIKQPLKKQANAPKQFELIHKNKIQLLR
jgi:hypothetical protein